MFTHTSLVLVQAEPAKSRESRGLGAAELWTIPHIRITRDQRHTPQKYIEYQNKHIYLHKMSFIF